jgi:hypothetical protein
MREIVRGRHVIPISTFGRVLGGPGGGEHGHRVKLKPLSLLVLTHTLLPIPNPYVLARPTEGKSLVKTMHPLCGDNFQPQEQSTSPGLPCPHYVVFILRFPDNFVDVDGACTRSDRRTDQVAGAIAPHAVLRARYILEHAASAIQS